jgi:glucose-6-phosphate 1-dehydrogenase
MHIQPDEGILLHFQAKQPGSAMRLQPVDMRFSSSETFGAACFETYETLLVDVMRGDPTLFCAPTKWRPRGPSSLPF